MAHKPEKIIEMSIQSQADYNTHAPGFVSVLATGDKSYCKAAGSGFKKAFSSQKLLPVSKLLALTLLDECVMTGNLHFLAYVQNDLLSQIAKLACYQKESSNENRGETMFGAGSLWSEENKQASIVFLNTALNCIRTWGNRFGKQPDGSMTKFYKVYSDLNSLGVHFPMNKPTYSPQQPSSSRRRSTPPRQEIGPAQSRLSTFISSTQATLDQAYQMISSMQTGGAAFQHVQEQLFTAQSTIQQYVTTAEPQVAGQLIELNEQINSLLGAAPMQQERGDDELQMLSNANSVLRSKLAQLQEVELEHDRAIASLEAELSKLRKESSGNPVISGPLIDL